MTLLKYKIIAMLFIAVFFISSCSDFGDMNENPNAPTSIANNPELLLTGICRNTTNRLVNSGWSEGNLMAQYGARIVFTEFDLFNWGAQTGLWNDLYLNARNAESLYDIGLQRNHNGYMGVSLILKSWIFQIMTDIYGDVPYSEALSGKKDKIYSPKYDPQEQIYQGIIADLVKANELLATNPPAIKGDIVNNGDLDKWRRFGNSLMLRAWMRLSIAKPTEAASNITQIVNNPGQFPIMESNSDNVFLTYLASQPNAYPISAVQGYRVGSFNEYRMGEAFQIVLQAYEDPRIKQWFDPTEDSQKSGELKWDGMLNGIVDGDAYVYKGGDAFLSKFNINYFHFSSNTAVANIMQYSEVEFIKAEAAQRGWIAGDAKTFYENAIKASFEYWDVEMPADYLTRQSNDVANVPVPVAYDGNIETIATQKWIALFYTDFQGFIEYKRNKYPRVIKPGPDAIYNFIPSRFEYPSQEQSLNATNWQAATQRQGPDNITTKVWWEK